VVPILAGSGRRALPMDRGAPVRAGRRRGGRLIAALVLAIALAGCENLVARVDGGSGTGINNAEFGVTF
jgi:hypothetical protein